MSSSSEIKFNTTANPPQIVFPKMQISDTPITVVSKTVEELETIQKQLLQILNTLKKTS